MNILITGGGGFVGSHLADAEIKSGNKVVAVDITPPDKVKHLLNNPNFEYVKKSMLLQEVMGPLVKEADLIYHFGAIANVQTYCKEPLKVLEVNIMSLRLVLDLAKR